MPDVDELIRRAGPRPRRPFDPDDLVRRVRRRRAVKRQITTVAVVVAVLGLGVAGFAVVTDDDEPPVLVGDDPTATATDPTPPTAEASDPTEPSTGAILGPAVDGPTWRPVDDLPRFEAGGPPPVVVATDTEIVTWGEYTGMAVHIDDGTPRYLAPAPIAPRDGAVGVWTGSEVIVWGGVDADGVDLLDGAAWDPATDSWRTLPTAPLDMGRPVVCVWTGRELVLWGRSAPTNTGDVRSPSAGAAYDPATDTWRELPAAPREINRGTGFWTGSFVAIVGGEVNQGGRALGASVTLLYDPATDAWEWWTADALSPEALWGAWDGTGIVLWDGTEPRFDDLVAEAERWDPAARDPGQLLAGYTELPPPPVDATDCLPGGTAGDGILATYCDEAAWWDGTAWTAAAPPGAFTTAPVALDGAFLAWTVDPDDPSTATPHVLRVPTGDDATTTTLPICDGGTTATVVAGEPLPPPTTAPPCVEPEPTPLDALRAEIEAEVDRSGEQFLSLGESDGVVTISFRADAEAVARDLVDRYGDQVEVTLGLLPYPDAGADRRDGACPDGLGGSTPAGLAAEIVVDVAPTHPGAWGSGSVELRNTGTEQIRFDSGSPLAAFVLDPSGELVGVFEGGIAGVGIAVDLAPGAAMSIPLVFGTASCDPALGHALPAGDYQLVAQLATGVVTATTPIRIPEA
jgi:hypothetical protein